MISKILHYEKYAEVQGVDIVAFYASIQQYLLSIGQIGFSSESFTSDGTLGSVICLEIDGKSFFFKTHRPHPFHRQNLEKEYACFVAVYGDLVFVRTFTRVIHDYEHLVIMIEALDSLTDALSYEERGSKILDYSMSPEGVLSEVFLNSGFKENKLLDFHFLYEKSAEALNFLWQKKIIPSSLRKKLAFRLSDYSEKAFSLGYLCHGDLSNRNIKLADERFIFIDWEDAMQGSRIYDFCYWMTFMDQRPNLQSAFFKKFCSDEPDALFYMSLILVLKSYLSVLDGSYNTHKLPIPHRLEELLDLSHPTRV